MRQEYPSLEITCVEIDAQLEAAQRASMLLSELMWPESGTREILHHNGSRHTRQIVPQSVSPFAHLGLALETTRLPEGCYIITGGLGGLGLVTAQVLVEMGASSLLLVSRSGQVQRTDQGLNAHLSALQERVDVRVASCDVTQESAVLQMLLRVLTSKFHNS